MNQTLTCKLAEDTFEDQLIGSILNENSNWIDV